MKLSKILFPAFLLFLCSCATELDFKMPINRMMIPETTGKALGFQGQVNYLGSEKVKLAEVADTIFLNATVSTEEGIDRSRGLGVKADLGVHERVDLYLTDSSDTSMLLGAKFQLLGTSLKDRKEKTFSLAIAGAYGSGDADEGFIITDDSSRYSTELSLTTFEYMVSLGYRATKNMMAYLTLFKSVHNVEAALKQNGIAVTNGIIDGDAEMVAANLGLHLSNEDGNMFGQLEVGYGYGKYENSLKKHAVTYAFNIGIYK